MILRCHFSTILDLPRFIDSAGTCCYHHLMPGYRSTCSDTAISLPFLPPSWRVPTTMGPFYRTTTTKYHLEGYLTGLEPAATIHGATSACLPRHRGGGWVLRPAVPPGNPHGRLTTVGWNLFLGWNFLPAGALCLHHLERSAPLLGTIFCLWDTVSHRSPALLHHCHSGGATCRRYLPH